MKHPGILDAFLNNFTNTKGKIDYIGIWAIMKHIQVKKFKVNMETMVAYL
jgi:hypothetical protein